MALRTTIRSPLPLSTCIDPLAVRAGTLKEKAMGGPICGEPSRLKRTRRIASALVASASHRLSPAAGLRAPPNQVALPRSARAGVVPPALAAVTHHVDRVARLHYALSDQASAYVVRGS